MQKFILRLAFFLPIVMFILFINWKADPAHFFNASSIHHEVHDYEYGIAQELLNKKNVTNVGNFDERLLQKYYINGQQTGKEVVVFGSSRSMPIDSGLFQEKSFFNYGVSGASLEDFVAIYDLIREKEFRPQMVVLEISPWMLNKNNAQDRWKSLEPNYRHLLKSISANSFSLKYKISEWVSPKIIDFISPGYFQLSWKKWLSSKNSTPQTDHAMLEKPDYFSTNKTLNDAQTILFDGSRTHDHQTRGFSVDEVRQKAIAFATQRVSYGLDSFFGLDKSLKEQLSGFINLLKKDNVTIIIFLPPYHPETYKIYTQLPQYKIIQEVEEHVIQLAKKQNLRILGSYNPNKIHIQEDCFTDGMHFKRIVVDKLFAGRDQ